MADFIAVIRRAVDGLSNNTPEMRAKVYDKARSAVLRQLENMSPRPPEEMLRRQLDKLETAINEVEAEHAEALPEVEELPEDVSPAPAAASWEDHVPGASESRQAPAYEAEEEPEPVHEPEQASEPEPEKQPEPEGAAYPEYEDEPHVAPATPASTQVEWAEEPVAAAAHETYREHEEEYVEPARTAPSAEYEEVEDPWQEAEPETPDYQPPASREPEVVAPVEPAPVEAPRAEEAFPVWEEETIHRYEEKQVEPVQPVTRQAAPMTDEAEEWLSPARSDFTAKPAPASEPVAYEPWDFPEDTPAQAAPAEEVAPVVRREDVAPAAPEQRRDHDFGAFAPAAPAARTEPAAAEVPDLLEWNVDEYRSPAAPAQAAAAVAAPKQSDDFSDWFADVGDLKSKEQQPAAAGGNGGRTAAPVAPVAASDEDVDAFLESAQQSAYRKETKPRRNFAPIVLGALGVLLLAGGGFAAWTYRTSMTEFINGLTGSEPPFVAGQPATTDGQSEPPATETPPAANGAATPPEEGAVEGQKFTQRLMADGSEVDEGAGTAAAAGADAEGKSVSQQNVASKVEPTDQPPVGTNAGTPVAPSTTTPPAAAGAGTAAGEKAFLYEEKLGQTTPVAVAGTVAWTAVRETGDDGKPNPEIQGKITIPERGMTALLTIRRNTDNSLPASHIIEVVFSIPPDFEGGAVDNLQRIAMKRTEQDRGDPLVAVSAQVTEDTYLVALNDFQDVIKQNLELLSTRGWIDMPITYRNGRRALLTLDKGAAGTAVFNAVLKEWEALGSAGN
ncbi:hypothetical protein ACO34A_16095 [Rhizobium sp. ACO-34A]|nr:hypothetical protein [Rhizobium sp. ACO-34A]ATN35325.1 hypothetical protein ACO34A_16095 [Rhizobium sp. ACO-34A]